MRERSGRTFTHIVADECVCAWAPSDNAVNKTCLLARELEECNDLRHCDVAFGSADGAGRVVRLSRAHFVYDVFSVPLERKRISRPCLCVSCKMSRLLYSDGNMCRGLSRKVYEGLQWILIEIFWRLLGSLISFYDKHSHVCSSPYYIRKYFGNINRRRAINVRLK